MLLRIASFMTPSPTSRLVSTEIRWRDSFSSRARSACVRPEASPEAKTTIESTPPTSLGWLTLALSSCVTIGSHLPISSGWQGLVLPCSARGMKGQSIHAPARGAGANPLPREVFCQVMNSYSGLPSACPFPDDLADACQVWIPYEPLRVNSFIVHFFRFANSSRSVR